MSREQPSPVSRSLKRGLNVLLVVAVAYLIREFGPPSAPAPAPVPSAPTEPPVRPASDPRRGAPQPVPFETPARTTDGGAAKVAELHRSGRSGEMVDVTGQVTSLLPPDRDGRPHQRFILRLSDGQTLLVAHNLTLAPSVPLAVGDAVEVRGQYEWNDRGGLLHWTHKDPDGRHPEGYVRHRGQTYH